MDRRSLWAWGASLAFACVCALIFLEWRSPRDAANESQAVALAAPKAPPSAMPAATPGTTNESLHAQLEDETAQMGIQAIGQQDDEEPGNEPFLTPGKPGSRKRAEETIRQIALMRKAIDRGAGKQDAVPIDGSVAPVLAQPDVSGGAIDGAMAADRWNGSYSGVPAGSRTIQDEKEWAKTWRSFSKEPPPAVDFDKFEAACIFLGARPTGGYSAEIVGAQTTESSLIVQYSEHAPDPAAPAAQGETSPYAIRLVPRSSLPVRYQKLR